MAAHRARPIASYQNPGDGSVGEDLPQLKSGAVPAAETDAPAAEHVAAIAAAGAAAHALLQQRLDGLTGAGFPEDVRHRPEHGAGPAGEDLVSPREVAGKKVGHGAAVAGADTHGGGEPL